MNVITIPIILLKMPMKQSIIPRMFSVFNQSVNKTSKCLQIFYKLQHNSGVTRNVQFLFRRNLSIHEITKYIKLYTEQPRNLILNTKTLRFKQDHGNRPLALILPFLGAKQKHIIKFANIYHSQGFDVVVGQIETWNMFVPAYTTQVAALEIVKFLSNNDYYDKIFVHGLSVGAYLYGECILHMLKDMQKYQSIFDRVQGEIWDSPPNVDEAAIGLSRSVFKQNPLLQKSLQTFLLFYLKAFPSLTSDYVRKACDALFHTKNIHAPCLFFLSKSDDVSSEAGIRSRISDFEKMNVECSWKCFDKSPHVQHYKYHPKQYTQALIDHLCKVKMLKQQQA